MKRLIFGLFLLLCFAKAQNAGGYSVIRKFYSFDNRIEVTITRIEDGPNTCYVARTTQAINWSSVAGPSISCVKR